MLKTLAVSISLNVKNSIDFGDPRSMCTHRYEPGKLRGYYMGVFMRYIAHQSLGENHIIRGSINLNLSVMSNHLLDTLTVPEIFVVFDGYLILTSRAMLLQTCIALNSMFRELATCISVNVKDTNFRLPRAHIPGQNVRRLLGKGLIWNIETSEVNLSNLIHLELDSCCFSRGCTLSRLQTLSLKNCHGDDLIQYCELPTLSDLSIVACFVSNIALNLSDKNLTRLVFAHSNIPTVPQLYPTTLKELVIHTDAQTDPWLKLTNLTKLSIARRNNEPIKIPQAPGLTYLSTSNAIILPPEKVFTLHQAELYRVDHTVFNNPNLESLQNLSVTANLNQTYPFCSSLTRLESLSPISRWPLESYTNLLELDAPRQIVSSQHLILLTKLTTLNIYPCVSTLRDLTVYRDSLHREMDPTYYRNLTRLIVCAEYGCVDNISVIGMTNLQELSVKNIAVWGVGRLPKLRTIIETTNVLSEEFVGFLTELTFESIVCQGDVNLIAKCSGLRKLVINQGTYNGVSLKIWSKLTNLTYLSSKLISREEMRKLKLPEYMLPIVAAT